MRVVALGLGLLVLAAAAQAAGQAPGGGACAAGLRSSLDAASFDGAGGGSRLGLEELRGQAEQRFRAVANRMCASGELRPGALRPFRRLLVQYGGGASETTIYVDPARPGALVFQYAFDSRRDGRFNLPAAGDVRDGIRCWSAPARHRRMCAQRMP